MDPRTKDETGNRYGRLTVLGLSANRRDNRATFLCECDCGARVYLPGAWLRADKVKSCGCLRRDLSRTHGCSGPKHKRTPEYGSWAAMIQRCTNEHCPGYAAYGAKGIKVCDRWRDFEAFAADMGTRPPGTSLDRWPNPTGDYEPGNCRWATARQQGRNKVGLVLDEPTVARMRAEMAAGARDRALCIKYGAHHSVVSRIRHGKAWVGVGPLPGVEGEGR